MAKEIKCMGASVRPRLLNISKESGRPQAMTASFNCEAVFISIELEGRIIRAAGVKRAAWSNPQQRNPVTLKRIESVNGLNRAACFLSRNCRFSASPLRPVTVGHKINSGHAGRILQNYSVRNPSEAYN